MKKIVLKLFLVGLFFVPMMVLANGDGYYNCEMDPIYERNDKGVPTMGLRLRERACMTDSDVIKVLPAGVEIDIIAETDGWYKVQDSSGAIGWVGARLVNITQKGYLNRRLGSEHYALNVGRGVSAEDRTRMMNRTRGCIVLAVESHGEAWYIDPITEKRYYMKNGDVAYEMMRKFGLGINNTNLEKLQNGDRTLLNRLRGRIVLAVERNGEAYYINPQDDLVHYLKNGNEAYRIMREQGLGITNQDLAVIAE